MNASGLIARARGILVSPREQLPLLIAESGGLKDLLVPYVLALAAIGPVMGFVSLGLIGHYETGPVIFNSAGPAAYVRLTGVAFVSAIVAFGMNVGAFVLLAEALSRLAPSFGGLRDDAGARKAAQCAVTPVFLAQALTVANSLPHLSSLAHIGLVAGLAYGVVITMWAVPLHLSVPEQKAPGHALAAIGITVVAAVAVTWLLTYLILAPLFTPR